MELEITPEPSPEERVAIEAALAELAQEQAREPGPWWAAGLPEADEEESPPAL